VSEQRGQCSLVLCGTPCTCNGENPAHLQVPACAEQHRRLRTSLSLTLDLDLVGLSSRLAKVARLRSEGWSERGVLTDADIEAIGNLIDFRNEVREIMRSLR
jgi:hypothetical protein